MDCTSLIFDARAGGRFPKVLIVFVSSSALLFDGVMKWPSIG